MSSRVASFLAWSICGLTLALSTCTIILFVLNSYDLSLLSVAEAPVALIGGLVASRRPANAVGWIIEGHALCFTLGEFTRQYAIFGLLTEPGAVPFARVMASPPYWIWGPGLFLMFSFLSLYFPNGRLISRRWRPVVWLAGFFVVAETCLAAVQPGDAETPGIPNPLGIEDLQPFGGVGEVIGPLPWLGIGAISVASLVVRFKRSKGEERQQMKWVVYAMVLLISYTIVERFFRDYLTLPAHIDLFVVVFEGLWVAIGVAVLKYRLYEIDIIINRTLVYGMLTASLALMYAGGVISLQYLFRLLTGEESNLAIVASTLIIAALFNPLRRRIQALVDRRFYRRKYDAAKTLEAFSARLRDETDLQRISDDLVGVVRETMQPTYISVWLRPVSRAISGVDPASKTSSAREVSGNAGIERTIGS